MKNEDEAWKSKFYIVRHTMGHWLVVEKGKQFSYNMTLYKTEGGAKKGARAVFDKINKEFEKILLK